MPTSFVSGVYEISLQLNTGLLMFYIGMAKRRLFERIKKLKNDLSFNRQLSALSRLVSKGNVTKVYIQMLKSFQNTHLKPK